MLARLVVLPAIGFDRDAHGDAREIQHEWRHRMLTAEMPANAVPAQPTPKPAFGIGRIRPGAAGQFDFVRHWQHPLPTLPPRKARERKICADVVANRLTEARR